MSGMSGKRILLPLSGYQITQGRSGVEHRQQDKPDPAARREEGEDRKVDQMKRPHRWIWIMIVALWANQTIGVVVFNADRRRDLQHMQDQITDIWQEQMKVRESISDLLQKDLEQLQVTQSFLEDLKVIADILIQEADPDPH